MLIVKKTVAPNNLKVGQQVKVNQRANITFTFILLYRTGP